MKSSGPSSPPTSHPSHSSDSPLHQKEWSNTMVDNFVKINWSTASQVEKCKSNVAVATALLQHTKLAEAEAKCHEAIDPLEKRLKSAWKHKSKPLEAEEMQVLVDALHVLEQVYRGQVKLSLADNILKRIAKDEWIQQQLSSQPTD